jgi:hypothetical protein
LSETLPSFIDVKRLGFENWPARLLRRKYAEGWRTVPESTKGSLAVLSSEAAGASR